MTEDQAQLEQYRSDMAACMRSILQARDACQAAINESDVDESKPRMREVIALSQDIEHHAKVALSRVRR